MKKWLLAFGMLVILCIATIYIVVPSTWNIVLVLPAKCNVEGADRMLRDTASRSKWWPERGNGAIDYRITGLFRRMVEVAIRDGQWTIPSRLSVFPSVRLDSCLLQWDLNLRFALNPVKRIQQYREGKRLRSDMAVVLAGIRRNLEDQEKVYGLTIRETGTTDSALVERMQILREYPTDSAVYVLVAKLRQFIAKNGGRVTGYPMVNVTHEPGSYFEVKVALPTDRVMVSDGTDFCRKLIHGKYLEADVRGGDGTVRTAMGEMRNYISDYQRTVMAIPFQSLVTDRMRETDTTKWLTKLYFPIF